MADDATAMFPLGTVLLPDMVLPLQVFEPRYQVLVEHCLTGDLEFGVVLIERGSEVGGGDQRFGVGCLARLLDTRLLDDGRWAVVAVGTRRIRVERWLVDDPYPRAVVTPWPDPVPTHDLTAEYDGVIGRLRAVLGLTAAVVGADVPSPIELTADPVTGSLHAGILAPLGPLDRLGVLAAESVGQRLDLLNALLDDQAALLRAQLDGDVG